MTEHEAARNDGTARSGANEPTPPPRDERPRPQYGEYAPEGWSWQPPVDAKADAAPSAPPTPPPPAPTPVAATGAVGHRPRTADRFVTILLLAFGALGAWNTSVSLQQLPAAVQTVYTQQGVGTYTPQDWLPALALVGTVFMLALYAAVLGWSILRLRARKLAFWVPLVGGAIAFLATMALTTVVFFTDPTFLAYVEGLAG